MLHISLAAEKIFEIGGLPITNSMLVAWIVSLLLIATSFIISSRISTVPGKFQLVMETVVGGLYGLFESVNGSKIKTFFPLLCTLFLFIILSNWIGLLPGVGTIGFKHIQHGHEEFVPLLRSASADLNTTLALALIVFVAFQYFGIRELGPKLYIEKYINLKNPIMFFVGILELISEFSKIISFAFRLFGNIFAGEVLLTVMAFLMPLLVPLPFLGLEVFVGFIQALVFSMLTSVFLSISTQKAEH